MSTNFDHDLGTDIADSIGPPRMGSSAGDGQRAAHKSVTFNGAVDDKQLRRLTSSSGGVQG